MFTRVASHLPAVTPLTLLELCLGFPAVTPQHCFDTRQPIAKLRTCRSRGPPAGVKCMCTRRVKSGHCVKSLNSKNTKKSPIHENADANITCDFGDGDISRLGVANQTHVYKHTNIVGRFVSWIILRLEFNYLPLPLALLSITSYLRLSQMLQYVYNK